VSRHSLRGADRALSPAGTASPVARYLLRARIRAGFAAAGCRAEPVGRLPVSQCLRAARQGGTAAAGDRVHTRRRVFERLGLEPVVRRRRIVPPRRRGGGDAQSPPGGSGISFSLWLSTG